MVLRPRVVAPEQPRGVAEVPPVIETPGEEDFLAGELDPQAEDAAVSAGYSTEPAYSDPAVPPAEGGSRPASKGAGGFGGGSPFAPKADYRATWFPSRDVAGQGAEFGVWRQDASASFPVAKLGAGGVSGSVNVGYEATDTAAVLTDSGVPFPGELWNVRFGASYMTKFENGWSGGGGVSLGSASDEPFSDIDVLQLSANGFLRVPRGERDAWLFSLFYSPTSEIPFPIPGVAYQWQPSDEFKMNVGLPFSMNWTPTERLAFEASYLPVRTVRGRGSYALLDSLKAYAGYERSNRSYFLADRPADDDRLFAYDQRLATGFEWSITEKVIADLSGGYAFDRFYFQGDNYDDRRRDRIDVADGPFTSLQIQGRW